MAALASLEDFYRLGLPSSALVPQPRPVESVNTSLDQILVKGHGLIEGDLLRFEALGTLPSPVVIDEHYTASPVDLDLFQVRYVDGPSAGEIVDITTAGTKPIEFRADPRPMFSQALLAASSTVQNAATAHSTIVEPTPEVIEVVCVLAAGIVMHTNRLRLPLNKDEWEALKERLVYAHARLKAWEAGKPIAGLVDATPTKAEAGARGSLVTGAPQPSAFGGWGWGCGL